MIEVKIDNYLIEILPIIIMGNYRITCANRDEKGVILQVCVGGGINTVEKIYNWIKIGKHSFFTLEKGVKAIVRTGVSPKGRKYVTTHPDGVTENNLDELKSCEI